MALHLVATSVRYAANGGVLGGLVGMHAAILPEHNGRKQGKGWANGYVRE